MSHGVTRSQICSTFLTTYLSSDENKLHLTYIESIRAAECHIYICKCYLECIAEHAIFSSVKPLMHVVRALICERILAFRGK